MRKRILSVITALILCLSMFPATALADEPQPAATEIELRQRDVNNEGTLSLADGNNYKLMGNIDISFTIVIEGTVSLDLNGYVLRQQSDCTATIRVESGTFTLKDSPNNTAPAHYFTVA